MSKINELIEKEIGLKIDGKLTIEDALAVLNLLMSLLETPEAKEFIKELLRVIESHIKESKNKVDDLIGLPCIAILRRVIGV